MKTSLGFAALAAAVVLSAACAASRPAPAAPASAPASAAPAPMPMKTAAAPAPAPAPAAVVAPKGERHKFWGDVESYDAASGTIVVKNRSGKSRTFRIAAAAKITRGGDEAAIAAADVAAGSSVRVTYVGDVLVRLHVFVKK